MSEQESRAVTLDTSASPIVSGGSPLRLGDLPAGTVLEREVIEVTRPGSAYREFTPGAITIKAG